MIVAFRTPKVADRVKLHIPDIPIRVLTAQDGHLLVRPGCHACRVVDLEHLCLPGRASWSWFPLLVADDQAHLGLVAVTEEDQIDPLSPVPRYQQVAGFIRRRIESGELQPGQPIPSQNQIIQRYGIARQTAHNALRLLVDEGLVVIVPGVGALVARRR